MNTEPSASFLRPLRRLLLLLAVLSLFGSVGPATHLDRVALFALYNATNGDDWTRNGGWKTASGVFSPPGTECSWFGIDCDDEDRVLDVKLRNNNLTGRIPAELGLLTGVRELDLGENRIEGEIPPELANMTSLEELELDDNRLTGGIPPELGRLPRLRDLDLDNNELNGSIPPELGQLAATMVDIDIDHNRFCGEIPPELGNLVRLRFLHLDDNRLTGTIPETFANLTELRELDLAGNKLEGPIPPGLRNLGNLEVEGPEREGGLDLRRNRLFIDPALDPDESRRLNVFLNERQQGSDWSATQTVAPSNVRAEATSDSVRILWDPIAFVQGTGRYQVEIVDPDGGQVIDCPCLREPGCCLETVAGPCGGDASSCSLPEPCDCATASKFDNQLDFTELTLTAGTIYSVRVRTVTDPVVRTFPDERPPQVRNQCRLTSGFSRPVEFEAPTGPGPVPELTLVFEGEGTGSVAVDPADSGPPVCVSTDGSCTYRYESATSVTLKAESGSRSDFAGFRVGTTSTTGDLTLTIDRPTTVTAVFVPEPPELTVRITGQGRVTVVPPDGGPGTCAAANQPCDYEYESATSVLLTAEADEGYDFAGFEGDGETVEPDQRRVLVDQSRTVTAVFEEEPDEPVEPVELAVGVQGPGSVRVQGPGLNQVCTSSCTYEVQPETDVTLTASAERCTVLQSFQLNDDSPVQGNEIAFTVTDEASVSAVFRPRAELRLEISGPGIVVVTPPGEPLEQDPGVSCFEIPVEVELVAQPADDFVRWGGALEGSTENPENLRIDSDRFVRAIFEDGNGTDPLELPFVVDSTDDEPDASPGNGLCATSSGSCTLRAAVHETNGLVSRPDLPLPLEVPIILLPDRHRLTLEGTDPEGGNAVTDSTRGDLDLDLTGPEECPDGDELLVRFVGRGPALTVIDATRLRERVLEIRCGTVELHGLTIVGDSAVGESVVHGGGIFNQGHLTLVDTEIRDASAGAGGGLYNAAGATATLDRSAVVMNRATDGGGIFNRGTLRLTNSTVSDSLQGGGIVNAGTLLDLFSSTVSHHQGVGVSTMDPAETRSRNSILANNSAGDCTGVLISDGYNLIEDSASGCQIQGDPTGNILGEDPMLAPAADYSRSRDPDFGTTARALSGGSPAIDRGNCTRADARAGRSCPADGSPDPDGECLDQRGAPRPLDLDALNNPNLAGDPFASDGCDMGAVEALSPRAFRDLPAALENLPAPEEAFRFVGLPLEVAVPAALTAGGGGVLGQLGLPGSVEDWRLFRLDAATQDYIEFSPGDPAFDFLPGRGFWLILREGGELDVATDRLAIPDPAVDRLERDWNLIGTPYNYPLDWTGCVQPRQASVSCCLCSFDEVQGDAGRRADYQSVQVMQPMNGYLVFNDGGPRDGFDLLPTCLDRSGANPAASTPAGGIGNWQVEVSATAGAASAQSIRLGMGPRACSCPSCTQLAATARSLTLSFHRPEWNERWPEFSSEIRPAPKASGWRTRGGPLRGGSWDFQLRTDSVRDTVELRWSLEGLEDEGLDLSLIDLENGRIVDMHAQGVYRVQAAPAGVHRFRIVAQ